MIFVDRISKWRSSPFGAHIGLSDELLYLTLLQEYLEKQNHLPASLKTVNLPQLQEGSSAVTVFPIGESGRPETAKADFVELIQIIDEAYKDKRKRGVEHDVIVPIFSGLDGERKKLLKELEDLHPFLVLVEMPERETLYQYEDILREAQRVSRYQLMRCESAAGSERPAEFSIRDVHARPWALFDQGRESEALLDVGGESGSGLDGVSILVILIRDSRVTRPR